MNEVELVKQTKSSKLEEDSLICSYLVCATMQDIAWCWEWRKELNS